MRRRRKPHSQSWRTFLKNHLDSTVAVDFFAVPPLTCRILFVFVVRSRTHLALGKDTPEARAVDSVGAGRIVARPEVGGLHHRYERQAA